MISSVAATSRATLKRSLHTAPRIGMQRSSSAVPSTTGRNSLQLFSASKGGGRRQLNHGGNHQDMLRTIIPRRYFSKHSGRQQQRDTSGPRSATLKRKKATLAGGGAGPPTTGEGAAGRASEQMTLARFRETVNQYLNKPRTLPIPRWVSPQHATISLSECFGHASFILVAISYAVDDSVQLRLIAIAGSSAMLFFTYFHPHGRVLWLPFKWNVLFIGLNAYRVLKVHVDRFFASQLSPLLTHMHEHHFYVMDAADFARLVRLGTIEHFLKGELLVEQNQENRFVRLVLQGTLNVERDGQVTYQLHEGNFISETGLHAGLLLRGNVNSCCDVKANDNEVTVLTWDRTELMHLLEVDRNIRRSIKAIMSWDIVSKLKSQRGLLATGLVADPEEWTRKRREQTLHRYKAILNNMLAHPQYLNKRKEELNKYRDIHHIDDEEHEIALKEMGWTLEEFEAGCKEGQVDEDMVEMQKNGRRWYAHEIYFRLFG
jgi:CRP-like cAMP-binding protein